MILVVVPRPYLSWPWCHLTVRTKFWRTAYLPTDMTLLRVYPVRTVYVPVPRDSVPQFSLTPSYKMCLKCIYVYTYLVPATSTPYLWNDRLLMHRHWHLVLAYLQQQAHRTSTHPCMHAHTICVTSPPQVCPISIPTTYIYIKQASNMAVSLFRSSALFALRAAKFGS